MKKTTSLKKNYEFVRIYKSGKFFAGKYIVMYIRKNRSDVNRLGITVNKKIGKSVKRNRVKRLIRESYRLYEDFIPSGLDIVIVARNNEKEYGFADVRREMKFILKKLQAFDQRKWDGLKNS